MSKKEWTVKDKKLNQDAEMNKSPLLKNKNIIEGIKL